MKRLFARLTALGLATLFTACVSASPPPAPAPAASTVPDLRGTWQGTWGGTPVTLVLVEQSEFGAYSGIYLGPVQLLGQRLPGLNGILTSTIRGEAVSISVEGWVGGSGGQSTVVLSGRMPSGTQALKLTRVEAERLAGTGESTFPGGPQGLVELTRQASTRPPTP